MLKKLLLRRFWLLPIKDSYRELAGAHEIIKRLIIGSTRAASQVLAWLARSGFRRFRWLGPAPESGPLQVSQATALERDLSERSFVFFVVVDLHVRIIKTIFLLRPLSL